MDFIIFCLVIRSDTRPVRVIFNMPDEPSQVRLVYRDIPFQEDNIILVHDFLKSVVSVVLIVESFQLVNDVCPVGWYDLGEAADDSHSLPRMMCSSSSYSRCCFSIRSRNDGLDASRCLLSV